MTRADKTFIMNEIIESLNSNLPRYRCAEAEEKEGSYKEIFLTDVKKKLRDYGELGEKVEEEIAEELYKKAIHCDYPDKEILKEGVRLNYHEFLFLSEEITTRGLRSTQSTLQTLADVMQEHDDERAEKIIAAMKVLEQIFSSKHERRGVNI